MPAPKGNQFWRFRTKHGRDTLFASPELLWEAACEYFEYIENNPLQEEVINFYQGTPIKDFVSKKQPFTREGLFFYIQCSKDYFNTFKATCSEKNKDFLGIINDIENVIDNQQFNGAASGFFNANIIARKLGLTDSSKQEITGKDGESLIPKVTKIEIIRTNGRIEGND